jgi:hypothetical protein
LSERDIRADRSIALGRWQRGENEGKIATGRGLRAAGIRYRNVTLLITVLELAEAAVLVDDC